MWTIPHPQINIHPPIFAGWLNKIPFWHYTSAKINTIFNFSHIHNWVNSFFVLFYPFPQTTLVSWYFWSYYIAFDAPSNNYLDEGDHSEWVGKCFWLFAIVIGLRSCFFSCILKREWAVAANILSFTLPGVIQAETAWNDAYCITGNPSIIRLT